MGLLFVNACMRKDSRTERLARMWLAGYEGEFTEFDLAEWDGCALDARSIETYERGVADHAFADELFAPALQFAQADEILIAAPLWNLSMPGRLHDYLEIVCTQGVSFDVGEAGTYVSLVRAKRLTYVATSGGLWPQGQDDHAFGYVRTLSEWFWHIDEVDLVVADGIDIPGADVEGLLNAALDAKRCTTIDSAC